MGGHAAGVTPPPAGVNPSVPPPPQLSPDRRKLLDGLFTSPPNIPISSVEWQGGERAREKLKVEGGK